MSDTRTSKMARAMGAALCTLALGLPAAAGAAGRYPDLRTLPIQDVNLDTTLLNQQNHYIVRFSNGVSNAGEGPLELHGTPHFPVDGKFDADQWIYGDPGELSTFRVGVFAYHPAHHHFHFDAFARYELWTKREFARAEAAGFTSGEPRWVSPKVTFCVYDSRRAGSTAPATYHTCTPLMEGLSPGWADVYDQSLADQWIDVGTTPLPDGDYVIRSIADPLNVIYESEGKANPAREGHVPNSAVIHISIVNGQLAA